VYPYETTLRPPPARPIPPSTTSTAPVPLHKYPSDRLWESIDQDGNRHIDRAEFAQLHDRINTQGDQADLREAKLAQRERKMSRTMKYMMWAIVGLVLFLAVSISANFGVVSAVVYSSLSTDVNDDDAVLMTRRGST
jgi:hypothetical protein